MGSMVADKCSRCGKIVVKHSHVDSSDMVKTYDSFLYLCDIKKEESGRPSLQLKEYAGAEPESSRLYCLDCLDATVHEWVVEMKKRGKSDSIPLGHILLPNRPISSPCPVCGR